jgi:hypothetical protein
MVIQILIKGRTYLIYEIINIINYLKFKLKNHKIIIAMADHMN